MKKLNKGTHFGILVGILFVNSSIAVQLLRPICREIISDTAVMNDGKKEVVGTLCSPAPILSQYDLIAGISIALIAAGIIIYFMRRSISKDPLVISLYALAAALTGFTITQLAVVIF